MCCWINCRCATNDRRAFTLVELLVTVAIIAGLVALLLPAIQAARESSRRSACQNNLKQIGLALLNYESKIRSLPVGAKHVRAAGFPAISAGTSWWLELLPELELDSLYARLDKSGVNSGQVLLHSRNGSVVDGVSIAAAWCPSSHLMPFVSVSRFEVMTPSYVGISGAASDSDFVEQRVNTCCLPRMDGEISAGGAFIPNRPISLFEVTDGTSSTLVVGECSASLFDSKGVEYRIDGGFRSGWLLGTSVVGTPPEYQAANPSWNITTLRHSINQRTYPLPGVYSDNGANNPLLSSHPGGVNLLLLDGSIIFAIDECDVLLLKSLATRDDAAIGVAAHQ